MYVYVFYTVYSYCLQLHSCSSSFFLPFPLFMFINGEGPGILGVVSYLTSESTYMFSVTTLSNT